MSVVRYRIAYFFYLAFIGAFSTQWVLYLKHELGFSDSTTGALSGLFLLNIIVSNLVLSRIADARNCRLEMQRLLSALGFGATLLWPWAHETWQVALVLLLQGWTCHVQVSMLDAAIVDTLGKNRGRYGTVRAFGTLGYAVGAFAISRLRHDDPSALFPIMQGAFAAFHLATWFLPRSQVHAAEKQPKLAMATVLSNRPLLVLLGTTFAYSCAFASYEVFGAVFFTEIGMSDHAIGNLYVASSAAEILIFFSTPIFLRWMHARDVLALSMLLCAGRWLLMSTMRDFDMLLLLQLSHALCFGLWYSAAVHLLGRLVAAEVRTSGQALFAMSFSAGFGAGGLLCGYCRESYGASVALQGSAVLAAIAGCVVLSMRHVFDDKVLSGDPRHVGAHGENAPQ